MTASQKRLSYPVRSLLRGWDSSAAHLRTWVLETKLTDRSQSRVELSIGPDKTQLNLVCKAVGPLSPLLTSPVAICLY